MQIKCPNDHRAEIEEINGRHTILSITIHCRTCKERYTYNVLAMENVIDQALRGKKRSEE